MVGVPEQAASMTTIAKTAIWTAALNVSETRVSSNAPFPKLSSPYRGRADYSTINSNDYCDRQTPCQLKYRVRMRHRIDVCRWPRLSADR